MRTKIMMYSILIAALMLGACNDKKATTTTSSQPAIAVVDVTRALRDSDAGKAGMKFLENIQEELQKEISALQEKIKAEPKKEEYQQQLQAVFMALQQRMQAEQQNVISRLNDVFLRVLEAQRAEKHLSVIIPAESAALVYDKSVDVTDAIIAAMNKEQVEYISITAKPEAAASDAKIATPDAQPASNDDTKPASAATPADKATESTQSPEQN